MVDQIKEKLFTGKYFSIDNCKTLDEGESDGKMLYAKNSKFYGKIMDDGEVYNPYIHRRWLPFQYLHILNRDLDVVFVNMPANYIIKYSIKEINTLIWLSKHDRATFEERSMFFSVPVLLGAIRTAVKTMSTFAYYKGSMEEIERLEKNINTYQQLKVFCDMLYDKKFKVPWESKGNILFDQNCLDKWKNAYFSEGAYFTMKHLIMFEGFLYKANNTSDSLSNLKQLAKSGETTYRTLQEECAKMIYFGKRKCEI